MPAWDAFYVLDLERGLLERRFDTPGSQLGTFTSGLTRVVLCERETGRVDLLDLSNGERETLYDRPGERAVCNTDRGYFRVSPRDKWLLFYVGNRTRGEALDGSLSFYTRIPVSLTAFDRTERFLAGPSSSSRGEAVVVWQIGPRDAVTLPGVVDYAAQGQTPLWLQ